jgi:hypothetical protein
MSTALGADAGKFVDRNQAGAVEALDPKVSGVRQATP